MTIKVFIFFLEYTSHWSIFRDLSTHTLKEDVLPQLHENILILLCNLEKIFPPAFFDIMDMSMVDGGRQVIMEYV